MKHTITKRALLTSAALTTMLLAGCAPAPDQGHTSAAPAVTSAATPSAIPDLEQKTEQAKADKAAAEKAKANKAAKEKAAKEKAAKEKKNKELKKIDAAKIVPVSKKTPINPQTNDADKDGLIDAWEIDHGTNKNNADTDGDGHSDGVEYHAGTSLISKSDYPGKPAPVAPAPKPAAPVQTAPKVTAPVQATPAPVPAPAPAAAPIAAAAKAAPVQVAPAPAPVKKVEAAPKSDGMNWSALAQCESGGNASAWNPAGYGGLYQFDQQTWNSVGGSGNPASASAAEQTKRAQMLYAQRGASPWPVCGAQL